MVFRAGVTGDIDVGYQKLKHFIDRILSIPMLNKCLFNKIIINDLQFYIIDRGFKSSYRLLTVTSKLHGMFKMPCNIFPCCKFSEDFI